MNECPLCRESAGFRVKLVDGGAMQTCRACGGVIPQRDDAEPDAAPSTKPTPAPLATRAVAERDAPLDVLKAAKARRRYLAGEIRRLTKLKAELDQIDRLLAAAKGTKAPRREGLEATVNRLIPRRAASGN